jgi:hypothetical protein
MTPNSLHHVATPGWGLWRRSTSAAWLGRVEAFSFAQDKTPSALVFVAHGGVSADPPFRACRAKVTRRACRSLPFPPQVGLGVGKPRRQPLPGRAPAGGGGAPPRRFPER